MVASANLLAFHPSNASKTIFITSEQLKEYISSTGVNTTEVDFAMTSLGRLQLFISDL